MFNCRSLNQHEMLSRNNASDPAEQPPSMQQPILYPHHPQQQQGQGQRGQGVLPQQQEDQPGQPMTHNPHGQIYPPPSLTSSQPQIGPGLGSTPMINDSMMHGTPGGMHVRVLYPFKNIVLAAQAAG